jgi:TolA-binding protein
MTIHRPVWLLLTALLTISGVTIPVHAQTAAELLQKGIYTQETAGDLDGAIAIYRQIVNSGLSPRDLAAQAQYRLAQSLLQKGDLPNGAQEFANLARNYADYGKLIGTLATEAQGTVSQVNLDRLKAVAANLQAADGAPITNGVSQPDETLYQKAIDNIKAGDYEAARLRLNTLINSYPDSEYLRHAKLAIADSWLREGGAYGFAQGEAELKDFILFYSNAAQPR